MGFYIICLDSLHDLGEQFRLFPIQIVDGGSGFQFGDDAATEGQAQSKDRADDQYQYTPGC